MDEGISDFISGEKCLDRQFPSHDCGRKRTAW